MGYHLEIAEARHEEFNPHDDALIHDVVGGGKLCAPIQELLILEEQIRKYADSFGYDNGMVGAEVIPKLRRLRAAFEDECRDL